LLSFYVKDEDSLPFWAVMGNLLFYIPIFLIGYLIGSVPTAYLLVKWRYRMDIRRAGTGNVGGLNSFEVTKSKAIGAAVLIIDVLKGVLAVSVVAYIFGYVFIYLSLAAVGAVTGHNFSVWIGFKGGRGLATAAGAMLLISPLVVAVWMIIWVVVFIPTRKVHWGNIVTTVLTPFGLLLFPGWPLSATRGAGIELTLFLVFGFVICGIIFLKHLKPLSELLKKDKPEPMPDYDIK
jgi:glycerol-3-phosphate acyltransferase PlsY